MPKKNHSKYLHFEHAKELIRKECIGSVAMYEKWYQHNKPNLVPRRPDILYRSKGWKGWNDFLGNNNAFFHKGKHKQFVSFDECKRYARSCGAKTCAQWIDYIRKNKPDNIPTRPDYIYKEWFTWKDFLGTNMKQAIKEVLDVLPVLFVIKTSKTPLNVFKVNVTHGGKTALIEAAKQGAKIIASFEYTVPTVDWRQTLSKYANNYWHGDEDDYVIANVHGFLFEISNFLTPLKF